MSLLDRIAELETAPPEPVAVLVVKPCWICRKPATHGNECESCNKTSVAIDKAFERAES